MTKSINAAGGLVINNLGQILLIHRLGKWDLPKGKQEPNESIQITASREVAEECGLLLENICLGEPICQTKHSYILDNESILKTTHWYLMTYTEESNLVPQTEEGIDKVCWVDEKDVDGLLSNSYDTIREVFAHWRGTKK